ncbi:MAG: isoprenyl transferase [Chlamydiae bacterium]|nr:isoprenyl transferase [Chlamydiota bacterium]MBI3277119.1 isoprenyl transferase [Chlamydiota bacterium]
MDDQMNIPQHIAIIMDGNGRWAKSKDSPRIEGHRAGIHVVRDIVKACGEWGVKYLTLYSFSIENWRRPGSEVKALMLLLKTFLRRELPELMKNQVRLMAIGRLGQLPEGVQKELKRTIEKTKNNTGLSLVLALSYGGRTEIIDATRRLMEEALRNQISPEKLDEHLFSKYLYTADIPDPDLLIRTSGEMRVSNFLLWQISYSEIWVTDTLWPNFTREELKKAMSDFSGRQRRFGGI